MPLYKPQFDHGGGGIINPSGTHLSIKAPDGTVVYENGKPVRGTEGSKWNVPVNEIPAGSTFSIDGGTPFTIKDPSQRNEYNNEGGDPTHVGGRGSIGAGGGMNGVPPGFTPGNIGYGSFPGYIGNMFPNVQLSPLAPYNFTDPMKFGEKFGAFNRKEIQKNFDLSKDLALKELSTELQGLQGFVPAASALKRNETALDNQFNRGEIATDNRFNQGQRTQQVNEILPNARGDLEVQRGRANTFAAGRVPDAIQDRALELGIRSASADRSAAGGFGASSSVARKASDLMSTNERIQLSKYGDSLLSNNISNTANLFLAPTEYSQAEKSNAGGQINVNPSVSASQLIDRNIAQINGLTSIPATQAFSADINQNQFRTNQVQANSNFNTTNQNTFALDKFGYQAGFANSVAGAAQTNTNTQIGLDQQQMFQQLTQQYMQMSQQAGQLQSIFSGLGGLFQGSGLSNIGSKNGGSKGSGGSGDSGTGDFFSATDSSGSADSFSTIKDAGIKSAEFFTAGGFF